MKRRHFGASIKQDNCRWWELFGNLFLLDMVPSILLVSLQRDLPGGGGAGGRRTTWKGWWGWIENKTKQNQRKERATFRALINKFRATDDVIPVAMSSQALRTNAALGLKRSRTVCACICVCVCVYAGTSLAAQQHSLG